MSNGTVSIGGLASVAEAAVGGWVDGPGICKAPSSRALRCDASRYAIISLSSIRDAFDHLFLQMAINSKLLRHGAKSERERERGRETDRYKVKFIDHRT